MKDQILKGYVNDFCEAYGLSESTESVVFEHFANHCVVSKQYPREFDFYDVHVGGQGDIGIDGAAFVVNGNIVKSPEEVSFLNEKNGYLDVSFCLIQAKKSPKFKGEQVGNLIYGIKTFFDDKATAEENDKIDVLRSIKEEIYRHSISFGKVPTLDLFFVTTGEWREPQPIVDRVEREIDELRRGGLFSSIEFHFYDAGRLKQAYREINRRTTKEIEFSNHVALPDIAGVRQAFIGSVPVSLYIDLITDSDGFLQKYLFDDNVRDYQGLNKVNKDIQETIRNAEQQAALPVFNNGITIIAKKLESIGKKLRLTDFQIVNGCQTSHVLFENKKRLEKGTNIIVKIIETTDYEFATRVVKATNWQTEVKGEAFESVRQFHRDLEEYYKAKAHGMNSPIYYERRSKQYDGVPSVKPYQVVTLPTQINAFVSGHLEQPQSTHRYYGELLKSNRERMFQSGDNLEPYYLCALVLKRVESAFRSSVIESRYKPMKYHILFSVYVYYRKRMQLDKRFDYEAAIGELDNSQTFTKVVKAVVISIENTFKHSRINRREARRSRKYTDALREEMRRQFR